MRIEKLYLKEVGPFDELRLDFPAPSTPGKADITILTGPNGCGKSTILYAIGALQGPGLGPDFLAPRLRSPMSVAAVKTSIGRSMARGLGHPRDHKTHDPWMAEGQRLRINPLAGPAYTRYDDPDRAQWAERAAKFDPALPATHSNFGTAAFAFAGSRTFEEQSLESYQELKASPFSECVGFARTTRDFAQWVAIQKTKEALARQGGDAAAADRYAQAVATIESVVGRIVGGAVRFEMTHEPLRVSLRRSEKLVRLDLLPDGLKSIVTWVGDLLMRLARIPWEKEVPLLERPFLLLLDEIEIHLHPKWQRSVLPIVRDVFPSAQVIVSTHSPFVVGSVAGATVHAFDVKDGVSTLRTTTTSTAGSSYLHTLRTIFQVDTEFDVETERKLDAFEALKARVLKGEAPFTDLEREALELAKVGTEVHDIVALEVRQTQRQLAATAKP